MLKSSVGSSIDVMLTNRPRSFHHTSLIETGLSHCHKLILSIEYRNYIKLSPEVFLHELDQELNKGIIYNSQDKQYDLFSDFFRTLLDHHAPLKTKIIRDNQAKLITKELGKSIMNRSRFENSYLKWPSRENLLAYKKSTKTYFEKATGNGIRGSEKFWSTVNSFVSLKDFIHNKDITIEIDNKIFEDKSELAKAFNLYYMNIVKNITGKHPTKLRTFSK